jgi:hypothetical protein
MGKVFCRIAKKSGAGLGEKKKHNFIHNDINLIAFVIPGLPPHPVRGRLRNPVFSWIPAFAGMTTFAGINVAVYSSKKIKEGRNLNFRKSYGINGYL